MKVTVKTMDSGSQEFELSDEETVGGLKEKILEKMGISLDLQRLIFQGKVMKDGQQLKTFGVHEKVIHLVKRPPPAPQAAGSSSAEGQGSSGSAPQPPQGQQRPPGMTVQATQDVVIMGNIPVSAHSDITQVTQNIVDQIVNSLSSQGAQAQVSAETITTDMSGALHTTTVSARSNPNQSSEPRAPPTTTSTTTSSAAAAATAAAMATPTPASAVASSTPQPDPPPPPPQPAEATAKPEPTPKVPPRDPAPPARRGRSLREQAEEHEAEMRRREAERNQRQLRTILSHGKVVRRCLQFATKVLDRYDRAVARVAAAKTPGKSAEEEKKEGEEWGPVEPMEVLEGGGVASQAGEEKVEAKAGEEKVKEKAEEEKMEEKAGEEKVDEKYSELDRQGDTPSNLSSSLYVRFLDDIAALQERVHPCVVRYRENITTDASLDQTESMAATREALTVKDFNYYIGHAYVSLSRLHVNMMAPPPRTIRLTAPRRTEMRRMMTRGRRDPAPRSDVPSGYIVDISRDDDTGEGGGGGERRSTRAIVNRATPLGSRGASGRAGRGAEGRGSGRGGAVAGGDDDDDDPLGFASLFSPALGFAEFMAARQEKREAEERRKKEEEGKATQGSEGGGASSGPPPKAEAAGGEKMEVEATKPKEEVRSKRRRPSEEGDEVRSKRTPKTTPPEASSSQSASSEKPPDKKSADGEEGEDSDSDGETPQYLARLLSELITGVADPAGPHRPSKPKDGASKPKDGDSKEAGPEEGGAKDGEKSADGAAPGKEGVGEGEEQKEEGAQPRTFAERYAGPEGTTVTISAAPAPPFGIPGLPPMEGPSLSIKNRGDGAEPEMTINFPMPPAIQLLQSLLERAEERHQQRREAGETSSEDSEDEEEGEGLGAEAAAAKKKEKKAKKSEKAFLDEDGEVKSISDAGSIDDIDSNHGDPPEFQNPLAQITASDLSSLNMGRHVSMLETVAEFRNHVGAPPEVDGQELGIVEQILKVVSRELTVVEVMRVLRGEVSPAEKLQPCVYSWVREKLLNGAIPTPGRKQQAVEAFLTNCRSTLEMREAEFPLRDRNIDFAGTMYKTLFGILEEAYDCIIKEFTAGEKANRLFSTMMHQWAIQNAGMLSNLIRHMIDRDELFDHMINKLIECLFPPNTPSVILSMCGDSIVSEMERVGRRCPLSPSYLDRYMVWKPGTRPTPNTSMPLDHYCMDSSTIHPNQILPYPALDSCPGGPPAEPADTPTADNFPPGVPEEWVSAIKRDSSAVSGACGPQVPYSQAYLSGMPAKRRKQLDTSEPQSISQQDLMLELASDALIKTGIRAHDGKSQLELLSYLHHSENCAAGVRSDMYSIQKDRLVHLKDFDHDRYPHTAKLYSMRRRSN